MCGGIAVANAHCEIALRPTVAGGRVAPEDAGSGPVVARLQALQPARIVLDATGGLAVSVTAAVTAAGWPVVVVHPRHARDVATATGRRATTEAVEAHRLAHGAAAVRPAPRPLPEAPPQALRAHLARRRQRLDRRTAEKHRLGRAPPMIPAEMQAPSTWLERRLADVPDDLGRALRASAVGRAHDDRLQSPPGGGPVRASTLGVDRPAGGPGAGSRSRPWSASPPSTGTVAPCGATGPCGAAGPTGAPCARCAPAWPCGPLPSATPSTRGCGVPGRPPRAR